MFDSLKEGDAVSIAAHVKSTNYYLSNSFTSYFDATPF